ncbi:MAG TPA: hypothetical protein VIP28_05055 [Nocardioides sp.]
MSVTARQNGWRGFDGIGEKVERIMGVKDSKSGWLYRCDGMPSIQGCGNEVVISRRFVRVGLKSTGWLVTYGLNDDGSDDLDVVLTFCPSCAAVVREQGSSS